MAYELAQRTLSFREDVFASLDVGPDALRDSFTAKLQRYDPRIIMVRANQAVVPGVPMKPGYYHVLIDNGVSVPLTITPVEGEHGEFVVPTSRVFEKLMAGDLRERRNWDRYAATSRLEQLAHERDQARDREERIDHRRDLVNAYTRTSVSLNRDSKWRQNQAGHDHGGRR